MWRGLILRQNASPLCRMIQSRRGCLLFGVFTSNRRACQAAVSHWNVLESLWSEASSSTLRPLSPLSLHKLRVARPRRRPESARLCVCVCVCGCVCVGLLKGSGLLKRFSFKTAGRKIRRTRQRGGIGLSDEFITRGKALVRLVITLHKHFITT